MMFDDKDSPTKFEEDIENMKVIDIKKKLKALGLSPTGNKSELVERLQVAMLSSGKDSSGDTTGSFPDSLSDLSPTKLNDQLLEDLPELVSSPKKELPSPKKELPAQDQMVTSGTPSVIPPVPLKKRAVLQTEAETVKPKKRIVLNRNNFPTPILSQAAAEPVKVVSSIEVENGKEPIAMGSEEIPTTSGSIKKVVALATEKKKVLTDAERLVMRAKRFNLTPEAIKAQNVLVPAEKALFPAKKEKSKVPAISPYIIPTNIDVLKKRAERFGENVSTVLIKLEEQEKINKRKSKFGEIKVASLDEQEKKKMRAERFKY